jgi:hypothetical protein
MIRVLEAVRPWLMVTGATAAALSAHIVLTLALAALTTLACIIAYEFTHERNES